MAKYIWTEEITLSKDEGRYYRACIFHHFCNTLIVYPLYYSLYFLAVLNPFKSRNWIIEKVYKFGEYLSTQRDFYKYWIYLNCNPNVWHALKDNYEDWAE